MTKTILCWFQLDMTQFLMLEKLQQKIDAKFYGIFDIPDKNREFFINQKMVNFEKIWFFHDEINSKNSCKSDLDKFESKYNIDLIKLALNERTIYRFYNYHKFSHKEIISILEHETEFFEKVLDEIKPDIFITREPGAHHHELMYELCLKKNIKPLMLTQLFFGEKCCISTKVQSLENELVLDPSTTPKSFDDLLEFRKRFDYSIQGKQSISRLGQNKSLNYLKALINYLKDNNSNVKTHYTYFGRTKRKVILNSIIDFSRSFFRKKFIDKKFLKDVNCDKFIYYPLSLDLERNLLINSPLQNNQMEFIRQIAKSLPPYFKLIVKEHPHQVFREWRPIQFYKEIMEIPNVLMIHPSVHSDVLYKNCKMVIATGGSSPLEASFFGKPSIILADNFYCVLPSIKKLKSMEELPSLIRTQLINKVNPSLLTDLVNQIKNNTFEFDQWKISESFAKKFYHNGNNHNVIIQEKDVIDFSNEFSTELDFLSSKFLEKI